MRFSFGMGLSVTFITSASPLGLAVKYTTRLPLVPLVRLNSRSYLMEVTLNRFIR